MKRISFWNIVLISYLLMAALLFFKMLNSTALRIGQLYTYIYTHNQEIISMKHIFYIFHLEWNIPTVRKAKFCITGLEDTEAKIDCVPTKVQTVTMINTVNRWSTYWTPLNRRWKESGWTKQQRLCGSFQPVNVQINFKKEMCSSAMAISVATRLLIRYYWGTI